jgi:hypothetical protein
VGVESSEDVGGYSRGEKMGGEASEIKLWRDRVHVSAPEGQRFVTKLMAERNDRAARRSPAPRPLREPGTITPH